MYIYVSIVSYMICKRNPGINCLGINPVARLGAKTERAVIYFGHQHTHDLHSSTQTLTRNFFLFHNSYFCIICFAFCVFALLYFLYFCILYFCISSQVSDWWEDHWLTFPTGDLAWLGLTRYLCIICCFICICSSVYLYFSSHRRMGRLCPAMASVG